MLLKLNGKMLCIGGGGGFTNKKDKSLLEKIKAHLLSLHIILIHISKNSIYVSKEDGTANTNLGAILLLAEISTYLSATKI